MIEARCSAGSNPKERGERAFADVRVGRNLLDGVVQVGQYEGHTLNHKCTDLLKTRPSRLCLSGAYRQELSPGDGHWLLLPGTD